MDRRGFMVGASALVALAFAVVPAAADPAFKRLLPLLIDLPGWTGAKPEGVTMEMGTGSMTTVGRKYVMAPARIDVAVISGPTAAGALAPITSGMKYETSEGHMIPAEIDGFRVLKTYNDKEKSGALLVALDKTTVMTFGYHGLAEDDGVSLARKLDWKALAAAAK